MDIYGVLENMSFGTIENQAILLFRYKDVMQSQILVPLQSSHVSQIRSHNPRSA